MGGMCQEKEGDPIPVEQAEGAMDSASPVQENFRIPIEVLMADSAELASGPAKVS